MNRYHGMILCTVLLLTSFAVADKTVQVSFNFPLDSEEVYEDVSASLVLPDDANSFTAFLSLAESEGVTLDISYFDFDSDGIPESAFVNSVNGITASEDFSSYWEFAVNNASSFVGISAHIPLDGDTVSLDYLQGPLQEGLEYLVDQQEPSGKIGLNAFQHSFALMALSTREDANASGIPGSAVQDAADYLLSLQEADGSFENDTLTTAVSLMALLSNGYNLEDLSVNNTTPADALVAEQNTDGGFESGTPASDVDTTSWVMLALLQSELPLPENGGNTPVDYLFSVQHESGAWGYNAGDALDQLDFTAEALLALNAAGEASNSNTQSALTWLQDQQQEDGCFSDGFRTALGVLVLHAYEADGAVEASECLETMVQADGSFGRSTNPSNPLDTGLALIALQDLSLPLQSTGIGGGNDGSGIGLNTIVKFKVEIENVGPVDVSDVAVQLVGIPADWLIEEGTVDTFPSLEPGEKVISELYVRFEETGTFDVHAEVSGDQLLSPVVTNTLQGIVVSSALLEAVLSFG